MADLVVGLLFSWLMLAAWPCGAASASEAGIVVETSGDTRLVRSGFQSSPLRQGAMIYSGDKLVTGAQARIEVRFMDDARIAIGPGSEFKVDEYYFEPARQRSFFSLARGMMRQVSGAIGKRNQDDYKLTTPTGVLAIRGTEFTARQTICASSGCVADQIAGLAVTVTQGRVSVSNAAGSVDVPAGSAIQVGSPTTPAVFTAGPRARGGAGADPRSPPRAPAAALPSTRSTEGGTPPPVATPISARAATEGERKTQRAGSGQGGDPAAETRAGLNAGAATESAPGAAGTRSNKPRPVADSGILPRIP